MDAIPLGGEDTLLFVDDESLMVDLFREYMSLKGYRVFATTSPTEALRIAERENGVLRLAITDMSLGETEIDGKEFATRLLSISPNLPVLIATGHDAEGQLGGLPSNVVGMIQKPFQNRALAERIRTIIESR